MTILLANHIWHGGGAGGITRNSPLSAIDSAAVFDIDATILNSYGGTGQTISNLIASPADGASQADYDFMLGGSASASTDDPTFNGTAGDPAAYFETDGADFISLLGSNTTFINDWHKSTSGQAWTCITLYRIPVTMNSGNSSYFGTASGFSSNGLVLYDKVRLLQGNGSSFVFSGQSGVTPTIDTPLVLAAAYNGAGSVRIWSGTGTGTDYSITYLATSADAAAKLRFMTGAASFMPNGTRFYAASAFNEALDDARLQAVLDHYKLRHNRDYYTP